MFLLLVNLLFLVLGCFLDTLLMLLVVVPIVMPSVSALGIDPVHFGVTTIVNMMIGMITPPYSELLFVVTGITGIPLAAMYRHIWPFIVALIAALLLMLVFSADHALAAGPARLPARQLTAARKERPGCRHEGFSRTAWTATGTASAAQWVDSTGQGVDRGREPGHRGRDRRACPPAPPTTPTGRVVAARAAQPGWEALPPVARGQLLHDLARLILENRERLARIVVAEQGKPLHEARGEIEGPRSISPTPPRRRAASPATSFPPTSPTSRSGSSASPTAWSSALTAWNYPAALMCRKMGPALVAGNTIVSSRMRARRSPRWRSPSCPSSSAFRPGVINVVSGTGEGIGAALVRHPIPRLITLTGSVRAGKEIFRDAADDLKILRLELGGKAPFIVAEDADIGAAVRGRGALAVRELRPDLHLQRAHVRARADRRRVPRPLRARRCGARRSATRCTLVDVGPKFSGPELDKVERMVDEAADAGAEVLHRRPAADGRRAFASGHWYEPTVLTVADNRMPIMQDEVFGPVVPVMVVDRLRRGRCGLPTSSATASRPTSSRRICAG